MPDDRTFYNSQLPMIIFYNIKLQNQQGSHGNMSYILVWNAQSYLLRYVEDLDDIKAGKTCYYMTGIHTKDCQPVG